MISNTTAHHSTVFAALADPTRHDLLQALSGRPGGASATSLAAARPISRQAVNKHLRVLQQAGLVRTARSGRQVLYTIRADELTRSAAWLTALAERWDQRLAGVKDLAEKPTATQHPDDPTPGGRP